MLFRAYKNLSSRAKMGVGAGIFAWGAIGLYLSDRAEDRFFTPTEEEKAALDRITPKITVVDRSSEK